MSVSLESSDKTFKPRIPKNEEATNDEMNRKRSSLKEEITTLDSTKFFENNFTFDDVIKILEKENESLSELLHYEETIRTKKLEEEKSVFSKDIDEEKNIISDCNDYVNDDSFLEGEADNIQEMLLKVEILHRKLTTLLKNFVQKNFPVPEKSVRLTRSRANAGTSKTKKSILDILKLLLPELSSTNIDNMEEGILEIDETMPKESIEFLISADIIERFPDKPDCIRLTS